MKLILGSSSKYRKGLLEKAGYIFNVIIPDMDEKSIITNDPYERPLILARAKADALIPKVKEEALIITSDTVCVGEGKLYEKPETEEEAREFLRKYSEGLAPEVVTAVVVVNTKTRERFEGIDKSKVFFKPFTQEMIESFIKEGEPLSRAGGFGIQNPVMRPFVDRIEGTEDGVIGIPLELIEKLLKEAGYK